MKTIHLQNVEKLTSDIFNQAKQLIKKTTGTPVEKVLPFVFEEALINFMAACEKNTPEVVILNYLNGRGLKHREGKK